MNRKWYLCIVLIVVPCMLIGYQHPSWAQEASKEFQETRDDFLKALKFKEGKTKELVPKGFATKGPEEIVYDELVERPTARSQIQFDFDSDAVKEESYPLLQNLAEVLTHDLPDAQLVIAGHTDSTGAEVYNMGLSERRAQAVKEVLVTAFAIESERLILRFFGETQPMASNDTKEGRAKNRRVEFIRLQ